MQQHGLVPQMSSMNHAVPNNAEVRVDPGGGYALYASAPIAAGEEITNFYMHSCAEHFRSVYGFVPRTAAPCDPGAHFHTTRVDFS
jgi:hypothetical protein